jgi:7-cyano-7-deazaguanine synthase
VKTIVLLSGGLDSATVLAGCVASGDECLALGFNYDQPHAIELDYAKSIADYYGVPFTLIGLPGMPKVDDVVFAGRNLILASLAIGIAQARKFNRIAVGCNASDWQRFPDCRPEFWSALERCADAYGVFVVKPLLYMSKRDVVEAARKLNIPIELTWSCYSPQGEKPCGECLACKTREEALNA